MVCLRSAAVFLRPEETLTVIFAAVREDIPDGFGYLAAQRLLRDDGVGFRCLAVVPALRPRVVTPDEVGRFDEGPCQVAVAALAVVLTLLLPVAGSRGFDHAAVAGKVFWTREAADVADLQHDRHGQDLSDARDAAELREAGQRAGAGQHVLLDSCDASPECVDVRLLDLGGHLFGRVVEEIDKFLRTPLLDMNRGNRTVTPGAHLQIAQAQGERGPPGHQGGAAAEKVAHGAKSAIADVTLRHDAQPQHVGEEERIALVVGVLETVILDQSSRIGEYRPRNRDPGAHQLASTS